MSTIDDRRREFERSWSGCPEAGAAMFWETELQRMFRPVITQASRLVTEVECRRCGDVVDYDSGVMTGHLRSCEWSAEVERREIELMLRSVGLA